MFFFQTYAYLSADGGWTDLAADPGFGCLELYVRLTDEGYEVELWGTQTVRIGRRTHG